MRAAAPFSETGTIPQSVGASADTRLAVNIPVDNGVTTNIESVKDSTPAKTLAYPTDSKEREKLEKEKLKAEGQVVEPKKNIFHIEDHHDDCGEDMASIDTTMTMTVESESM